MRETTFTFKSSDNISIHVYKWEPEPNVEKKAVVQIVHGSVEHAYRYRDFATFLVQKGFVVYANDHRGHGKTAKTVDNLSYFSDQGDGFDIAVDDLKLLNDKIHEEHSDLKVFVLGHSLGSFMLRKYITKYQNGIDGVLLSGTGGGKRLLMNLGILLANRGIKKKGRKYNSKKLHNLLYGSLNKQIKNYKTDIDFISRDPKIIDEYNNDPFSGHTITTEYAKESLKGIKFCGTKHSFANISKELPIYILSGQNDPVGGKNAKEVRKIYNRYLNSGVKDININIYKDARHEILNEINKEEVYQDIVNWINERLV